MVMNKKSTALVVFLFSVAIAISVCAMPAFAKINYEAESSYDFDGSSAYYGEEIHAKVTINPGENEVKDMRIDVLEADALIDDNSFKHTISPTGADISITRGGHTFFCDSLKRGESITLMFKAYPKTIKEEDIKVADVRIAYSQLGQRLEDSEEIKAILGGSFWFKYEDAQKMASSANWLFYVGIAGIIVGAVFAFAWLREKRTKELKIGEKSYDFMGYLRGLKKQGEEKKIDRDLVRDVEDKIEEIGREKEYNIYKKKYEKYEEGMKGGGKE